jgi:hypothetical protein
VVNIIGHPFMLKSNEPPTTSLTQQSQLVYANVEVLYGYSLSARKQVLPSELLLACASSKTNGSLTLTLEVLHRTIWSSYSSINKIESDAHSEPIGHEEWICRNSAYPWQHPKRLETKPVYIKSTSASGPYLTFAIFASPNARKHWSDPF